MQHTDLSPPIPLWQSREMAAALALLGVDARMGRIGCAHGLIVHRRFGPVRLSMTSRGPVFPAGTCEDQIALDLASAGPHLVTADALSGQVMRKAGYLRLRKGRRIALLDTAPDLETQLGLARPKWRNSARQGLREAGTARFATFDAQRDGWLLDKDRQAQAERRFRALPHALVHAYAAAAPGQVRIASIGRMAGLLFLVHGSMATWHLGWTDAEGRTRRAHHALLMQSAVRLWAEGVRVIDLGLAGPPIPDGIAAFKAGTGARIIETGGSWIRWRLRRHLAGQTSGRNTIRRSSTPPRSLTER